VGRTEIRAVRGIGVTGAGWLSAAVITFATRVDHDDEGRFVFTMLIVGVERMFWFRRKKLVGS
jgi:hypothetical protein